MSQLSPADSIIAAVDAAIATLMAGRSASLRALSHHADELLAPLRRMTAGGKRTRAVATWWGFEIGAGGLAGPGRAEQIASVAASVELFHAAALIHDDVIDNSETRRGRPAVHTEFRARHTAARAHGDAARFGANAAIIAGDLLVSLSEQLYAESSLPTLADPTVVAAHNAFRQDIMLGQYLDIRLQDAVGATAADPAHIGADALEVLTLKSAKYSVEQPFVLGAALAGATAELREALSGFGLPLGRAFQMRDDVLGIFGDPQVTGKPAGDDLYEGKRTLLVGLALGKLDGEAAAWFLDRLGNPSLTAADIDRMKDMLRDSGALTQFEDRIAEEYRAALTALNRLGLEPADAARLGDYAARLVDRVV